MDECAYVFFVEVVYLVVNDSKEQITGCSADSRSADSHVTGKHSCMVDAFCNGTQRFHSQDEKKRLPTKSRTEDMLKRVKDQPTLVTNDPLNVAAEEKITILSLEEAQLQIKKLPTTKLKVKYLWTPFLKVDVHGNYQPESEVFLAHSTIIKWRTFDLLNWRINLSVQFWPTYTLQFSSSKYRKGKKTFEDDEKRNIWSYSSAPVSSELDLQNNSKVFGCAKIKGLRQQECSCEVKGINKNSCGIEHIFYLCLKNYINNYGYIGQEGISRELNRTLHITNIKNKISNQINVNVKTLVPNNETKVTISEDVFDSIGEFVESNCAHKVQEKIIKEHELDISSALCTIGEILKNLRCMCNTKKDIGKHKSVPNSVNSGLSTLAYYFSICKIACSLYFLLECHIVKLKENVKFTSFLYMPIRPMSGKLFMFCPGVTNSKKSDVIHTVLIGGEQTFPAQSFVDEARFYVISIGCFAIAFSQNFHIVTEGSKECISSYQSAVNRPHNVCKCKKLNREKDTFHFGICAFVEQFVTSRVIPLKLDAILTENVSTETKYILAQFVIHSDFDLRTNLNLIFYLPKYSNILILFVIVGSNILISFLKWAIEIGHFEELCKVKDIQKKRFKLMSSCYDNYKCKTSTFELLLLEKTSVDVAFQNVFHEAIRTLIHEYLKNVDKIEGVNVFGRHLLVKNVRCYEAGTFEEVCSAILRRSEVILLYKLETDVSIRPVISLKNPDHVPALGLIGDEAKRILFGDLPNISLCAKKFIGVVLSRKLLHDKAVYTIQLVRRCSIFTVPSKT